MTKLIASANTAAGYAIGIISQPRRDNGKLAFSVIRMNRRSQYVVLSVHNTEAEARTAANAEYKADRKAA